jgi:orotidine-5'-phosphate decarboxylase
VTVTTPAPVAVALDAPDLETAARWAELVTPHVSTVKVGLELYLRYGPDVVATVRGASRVSVFLDLKLHDIPTTVHRAARVIGAFGADYLTLHAQGGVPMLRAGVGGLAEGAERAGLAPATALAVTILTSDGDAPEHILPKRVGAAVESGCGGIVCAATDVRDAALFAPRLTIVVPGIRPEGVAHHDQARAATPREALDAGADLLVIGRAVTEASDPCAAAENLVSSIA